MSTLGVKKELEARAESNIQESIIRAESSEYLEQFFIRCLNDPVALEKVLEYYTPENPSDYSSEIWNKESKKLLGLDPEKKTYEFYNFDIYNKYYKECRLHNGYPLNNPFCDMEFVGKWVNAGYDFSGFKVNPIHPYVSLNVVKVIVKHGFDPVNFRDVNGRTLPEVTSFSNTDVIIYLHSLGVEFKSKETLWWARPYNHVNFTSKHLGELIDRCNIDVSERDSKGNTALFYYTRDEMANCLIDRGIELNVVNNDNKTVLTYDYPNLPCVSSEVIARLIRLGESPFVKKKDCSRVKKDNKFILVLGEFPYIKTVSSFVVIEALLETYPSLFKKIK